ncbi:hypothetical protein AMS68_002064 [Peltaster fructicola]|uniref:Uncharacterized protein n=1 Tax=Peltaster fructicola TaxID=286661 RepID=A0A6H0XP62_9PEZI|nr:hypothetical protein AMS68_002064 [Peltaster fructicola]
MRFLFAVLASIALPFASAIIAHAGTLTARGIPDRSNLYHNASLLLGWDLVGMFNTTGQLALLCDNLDTLSGRLEAVGLVVEDVKAPVCISRTAAQMPTPLDINAKLIQYYSDLFVTVVLNAFALNVGDPATSRTWPFRYLCQTGLSYGGLEQFGLDAHHVMEAVCAAGGVPVRPEEEGEATHMSPTALDDFFKNATQLLAYEVATAADDIGKLNALCSALPSYAANIQALGLDPATATATLCDLTAPLTPSQSIVYLTKLFTECFLLIVRNSSKDVAYWNRLLCISFDANNLNAVGLNAIQVFDQVCT